MKKVKIGGQVFEGIEKVSLFDDKDEKICFHDNSCATACAEKMLVGTVAVDANGEKVEGAIPVVKETKSVLVNDENGITINTSGSYFEKDIEVVPKLQDKTVTGNGTVTADEGFAGLSKVNVMVSSSSGAIPMATTASGFLLEFEKVTASSSVVLPIMSATSSAVGTIEKSEE